jgi:hypothetical protein
MYVENLIVDQLPRPIHHLMRIDCGRYRPRPHWILLLRQSKWHSKIRPIPLQLAIHFRQDVFERLLAEEIPAGLPSWFTVTYISVTHYHVDWLVIDERDYDEVPAGSQATN